MQKVLTLMVVNELKQPVCGLVAFADTTQEKLQEMRSQLDDARQIQTELEAFISSVENGDKGQTEEELLEEI